MLRLLAELLPTLLSAMNSLCDLVIENLALHQQLATLAGEAKLVPGEMAPAGSVLGSGDSSKRQS